METTVSQLPILDPTNVGLQKWLTDELLRSLARIIQGFKKSRLSTTLTASSPSGIPSSLRPELWRSYNLIHMEQIAVV